MNDTVSSKWMWLLILFWFPVYATSDPLKYKRRRVDPSPPACSRLASHANECAREMLALVAKLRWYRQPVWPLLCIKIFVNKY